MNPDAYIPFYGNDFFQAVEGESDLVVVGYMRAIWNYWHHTHCDGLRNDSEFLRKICRIEKDAWAEAEAIIFDNDRFFTLGENGKWHQKKAYQKWIEVKTNYDAIIARSKAGAKARWKGHKK